MCGIVGYVGSEAALGVLVDGLHRLEYRGYDSAGVAVVGDGAIEIEKCAGKVGDLASRVDDSGIAARAATLGIGHTRWATHGAPTGINAHPHSDCTGRIAIVHNGIIENHRSLAAALRERGHDLKSATDSELLAHLLEEGLSEGRSLSEAALEVLGEVEGSVAMVTIDRDDPGRLVAVRRDSPLLVGIGSDSAVVASDIPAILEHTRRVVVMSDGQVAEVGPGEITVFASDGAKVAVEPKEINWDLQSPEKAGYPDFMLKEIHEQPSAIRDTIRGRFEDGKLRLDEVHGDEGFLRNINKIVVVACGTSFHAGMVAKYAIEHWARIPVEIDLASEFRYRDPVLDDKALVVAVSQSGETADTVAACRYAKSLGARVVAVCNVVDSSMAREADAVLYTRAGPEVGVAATKTFTAQMAAMELLALYLAQVRESLSSHEIGEIATELGRIPGLVDANLESWSEQAKRASQSVGRSKDFFFLGRGVGYPVAMEGALKLKEISYLHAEGYAAGEMKHGPIALVEPGVVVVVIATSGHVKAKVLSNMQEMKARGATVLVIANDGDDAAIEEADFAFTVPEVSEMLSPLIDVVPCQLFAYEIALSRGLDVDKPRNLAKTVTVE
ncbi:MAG: glutamine--fructose-6-phosphate transaminase (isomerizing) [Acidobacteria bacterium]|nr:MAG: glutamine--fructose-6-phosphate transaminase (isomerizing) [Acidobacteriota bacterium]